MRETCVCIGFCGVPLDEKWDDFLHCYYVFDKFLCNGVNSLITLSQQIFKKIRHER